MAAAHGAFHELISDGVDGVLFKPGSVASLAATLHDVESHPDRYRDYGRAARRTYEKRFDPDRNLDQLLEIYRFALERPIFAANGDCPAPRSAWSRD